jgi:hypothetical protein
MPPKSYIIAAVVLGALVGVSFFLTLGFSMTAWFWTFAIAACILGTAGAFNIADGLGSPRWIGAGLASPGLVWLVGNLREWFPTIFASSLRYEVIAAYFAALAAGAGALKLVEITSRSHAAARIGYALLAMTALWVGIGVIAIITPWPFFKSPSYFMTSRTVFAASAIVEYGAFVGAAVLITIRHDVERWSCVAISLVSSFLLYKRVYMLVLLIPLENVYGFVSWLQAIAIFIGAAAVWRMGVILRGHPVLKPLEHPSPA